MHAVSHHCLAQLQKSPELHFACKEYLLADSGFSPSKRCIPAFKRPRGLPLIRNKRRFNFELSRQRIRIEHAIGMLKSRWQSLRELRIQIKDASSAARANMWMQACIILHNYLVDLCDTSTVPICTSEGSGPLDGLHHPEVEEEMEDEGGGAGDIGEGNALRDYVYSMCVAA